MKRIQLILCIIFFTLTAISFSNANENTSNEQNFQTQWEQLVNRNWRILAGISLNTIIPEGIYNNLFLDLLNVDYHIGTEIEILDSPSISIQTELAFVNRRFYILTMPLKYTNEILQYVSFPITLKISGTRIKDSVKTTRVSFGIGIMPSILFSAQKEIRTSFESDTIKEPLDKTHWYDLAGIISISWTVPNTFLEMELRATKGLVNIVSEPTEGREIRINNSVAMLITLKI